MPKVQSFDHEKGGHSRRARRTTTALAEINVVPLVDVMLVLLIIFMVTAPMLQQGLEVNLPQARRAKPLNVQPVYVTVPADFSRRRVVQVDKDEVRVDIMHERVRQALLTRDDKSVYIRADGGASVQDLMTVTDKLREAGVDKVGLMSKPPEKK
jgi:biopolymer transport protein ExbD